MNMNRITMTSRELDEWKNGWPAEVAKLGTFKKDGVTISAHLTYDGHPLFVTFAYKNARGVLHPDNGYLGPQPGGKDYYPLVRVSPSFSSDSRFTPTVAPELPTIAEAIIQSWNKFIAG